MLILRCLWAACKQDIMNPAKPVAMVATTAATVAVSRAMTVLQQQLCTPSHCMLVLALSKALLQRLNGRSVTLAVSQ